MAEMQSLKMDSFCELWRRCQSLGLLADHTTNEFQVVHQKGRNEAVQDLHSHDPCHLDNIRVISGLEFWSTISAYCTQHIVGPRTPPETCRCIHNFAF